jgi:hypothetical protein
MHSENKGRLASKKIKIKQEKIENKKRRNILKLVGEMEIILGLNFKQSVSCSCMNHQFYISLKFCMQLIGDVNKTVSSCCFRTSEYSVVSTRCLSVFFLDMLLM